MARHDNASGAVVNCTMPSATHLRCTALSRRYDVLILCARIDFTP